MTADLFGFVSFAEYCLIKRLHFSILKYMFYGARTYRHRLTQPVKQTPAMLLGNVIHKMVLEPSQFDSEYAIWTGGLTGKGEPTMSKNSSAFKAFQALEAEAGRIVIDDGMVTQAKAIRESIMSHPKARTYIEKALVEQTVLWDLDGFECKSRIDIVQPGFICDLKSTVSADPFKFGRQAGDMKYHAQMAFYRAAWEAHTGDRLPCKILAVEKVAPYEIGCFEVPEMALLYGQDLYMSWIETLKQCIDTGLYPFRNEIESELSIPDWMLGGNVEIDESVSLGGKNYKLNEETGELEVAE